ncbi:MAG: lytic transglycosylase domain-containing protein [Moraxellaceae bacterium]|nr:lytic transglycosylase domain-containing protein [Pseudobdellovibrionaceae bacterium]
MRALNIKIQFLVFSLVIVSYFNSCRSPQPLHNEADRQQQAKEILNNAYSNSPASRFETDAFLSSYIEEYLRKNGRQLASADVVKTLIEVSRINQYDPIFLMAIIKTESQFRPHAIGSAGEIGLMQIKPDTAKWICEKKGMKWKGKNSLKNPQYNIEVGALYFKYLKKSLRSRAASYITAYNTGMGQLSRMPSSEVKNNVYFSKVLYNYLSIYKELEEIKANRQISKR